MTLSEHQHWLTDFYKQRNWYQLSPFIRLNFLTEEVGEVSQAIRAVEIGAIIPAKSNRHRQHNATISTKN